MRLCCCCRRCPIRKIGAYKAVVAVAQTRRTREMQAPALTGKEGGGWRDELVVVVVGGDGDGEGFERRAWNG